MGFVVVVVVPAVFWLSLLSFWSHFCKLDCWNDWINILKLHLTLISLGNPQSGTFLFCPLLRSTVIMLLTRVGDVFAPDLRSQRPPSRLLQGDCNGHQSASFPPQAWNTAKSCAPLQPSHKTSTTQSPLCGVPQGTAPVSMKIKAAEVKQLVYRWGEIENFPAWMWFYNGIGSLSLYIYIHMNSHKHTRMLLVFDGKLGFWWKNCNVPP